LALIKFFEVNQEPAFWEPEHDPFERPIDDADVKAAILANKATVTEEFDLARELVAISRSLNSEAITKIASQITAADLYSLIKARENESMRTIIYAGLEFAKIGNASPDMIKIVSATKEALRMLANESKLNAARVKKYGVSLETSMSEKHEEDGDDA
jgi:hypothetical protein